MKNSRYLIILCLVFSFAACANSFALSETRAAVGKTLLTRYTETIVTVEISPANRGLTSDQVPQLRDNRIEVNGTVISPAGLTVTALSSIAPRGQMELTRANQGSAQRRESGESDSRIIKLVLVDGSEIPAKIVLKNQDLDLVFIAPVSGSVMRSLVFSHVNLKDSAVPEILGEYFLVSHAAKIFQHASIVRPTTMVGIVEKPKRLFLLSDQAIGAPIFDLQGRVLGITMQYFVNGRPGGLVVIPASDIDSVAPKVDPHSAEETETQQKSVAP